MDNIEYYREKIKQSNKISGIIACILWFLGVAEVIVFTLLNIYTDLFESKRLAICGCIFMISSMILGPQIYYGLVDSHFCKINQECYAKITEIELEKKYNKIRNNIYDNDIISYVAAMIHRAWTFYCTIYPGKYEKFFKIEIIQKILNACGHMETIPIILNGIASDIYQRFPLDPSAEIARKNIVKKNINALNLVPEIKEKASAEEIIYFIKNVLSGPRRVDAIEIWSNDRLELLYEKEDSGNMVTGTLASYRDLTDSELERIKTWVNDSFNINNRENNNPENSLDKLVNW